MNKRFLAFWIDNPYELYVVDSAVSWNYKGKINFYEFRELLYKKFSDDMFLVKTRQGILRGSRRQWITMINEVR